MRQRNQAAGGGADADHIDDEPFLNGLRERALHVSAPDLPIRNDHHRLGILAWPVHLLVGLDELHPPADRIFGVGIPRGIVLELERGLLVEVIEEEEHGVGVAREPDLRQRDIGEGRQRHAIAVPGQRLRERAHPRHGALPSIGAHVGHAHRGRTVHQQQDVGAGTAHNRRDALRPRQGRDRERERQDAAQPERQIADSRKLLTHRHQTRRLVSTSVGTAPEHAPAPQREQQRRRDEQPQIQRLGKTQLLDAKVLEHKELEI